MEFYKKGFKYYKNNNNFSKKKLKKIELLIFFIIIIKFLLFKIPNSSININNEIIVNDLNNIINDLNITNYKKINKKIKIAVYAHSLINGGVERLTATFINYISKIKIFEIYLFLNKNGDNEYQISKNINVIKFSEKSKYNLKRKLIKNEIDIFIYQFYNEYEIGMLNNLKKIKTIFYNHSCFLIRLYIRFDNKSYNTFKNLYNAYKHSKYVISLIHLENDYLFKKWGINSIFVNNFISYDYDSIIPSDLSSKTILMIGRGNDITKRFYLGIQSMKYIVTEIPQCDMKIISDIKDIEELKNLVKQMNLENNIKFIGYTSTPEIYFKNASLHILPSICESFGLSISETKAYGIPNILTGLDYISPAKGGVINIYDDKPQTIAKEAIKILKDEKYRKKLGMEARISMRKFKNEMTTKKWIKIILSIYNGDEYYNKIKEEDEKLSENELKIILKKQLELLKIREKKFENITIDQLSDFNFVEKIVT